MVSVEADVDSVASGSLAAAPMCDDATLTPEAADGEFCAPAHAHSNVVTATIARFLASCSVIRAIGPFALGEDVLLERSSVTAELQFRIYLTKKVSFD